MILYHGSTQQVHKPALNKCRANTDFGRGFYCTTNREQAEKWALLKKQREAEAEAVLNIFSFDENSLEYDNIRVLIFEGATLEWLNFVMRNRRQQASCEYDIVRGPVANDRLYATLSLYEQGILTVEAAVIQLKTHKLFDQYSFHTSNALVRLIWLESVVIKP